MSRFVASHKNAGVLIVTDLYGRQYVPVDLLLCVVSGRQFYPYEIQPFLKSYGFTARPITSMPDIRLAGTSAYERLKGIEKMTNPMMLLLSESIELCMSMYQAPTMTPQDKCEVVRVLSALGAVHDKWSAEVQGLVDILTQDAQFSSVLEDEDAEKLRRAKNMEEVRIALENMWKTHPYANKLRSKLRALIKKTFPSLTAAFNLSRCALSITFDGSLKRGRPDLDNDLTHEEDTSSAPSLRQPNARSGYSGSRHVVRCVDVSGEEQRFNVCIERRDWCRTVTRIDDLVSDSKSGYIYVHQRGNEYQFVFSPDTRQGKQYKSPLFARPEEAASHALLIIGEFAKA